MSSLSGIIKSIQNIMRKDHGVDGDAQRLSQLVWMLFLKIFDETEEEKEVLNPKYKSPIPEDLRWRNWAEDDEGMTGDDLLEFINNKLFPTFKNLEYTAQDNEAGFIVKSVFEDSFNYMKSGTLIRQVINKINDIDFNRKSDRDQFGLIYEELLRGLQSAGNAGEFYTPRALTEFIVEMVNPRLGEKVYDPACGTGGFLTSVIERIRQNDVHTAEDEALIKQTVKGNELKQLPHLLCITNMILHGITTPTNLSRGDSLAQPIKDIKPKQRVDCIVANPPFGGTVKDGILANFPSSFRTKETADLFLTLFIKLLKINGRAGIVLPDGSLTGEGVKARIREKLLKECNLHTIIRLPNSVFSPYAAVATNLLFFTKGEPTKEVWYYDHKLPEGQKSYSKTKPIEVKEFDEIKLWWNNRAESDVSWKVTIEEIRKRNWDLDIKNPHKKIKHTDKCASDVLHNINSLLGDAKLIIESLDKPDGALKTSFKDVKIGDVCTVTKGKTGIKKAVEGAYPMVTLAEARISHNEYQFDCAATIIPLVSSTGHGHASIKRIHYQEGKFALGSILCAVRPNDKEFLDAKYLYIYLSYFKDFVLVPLMKGAANVSLSVTRIKSVTIKVPSLDKQKMLVDLYEKVQLLSEKMKKSDEETNLLMKSFLSETFKS